MTMSISYQKAWRSKEVALNSLFGDYKDSYNDIPWYCNKVVETNPGSVVKYEVNRRNRKFLRCFIALNECIQGFQHCRPLLFLDGAHLYGKAKGTLLAATAVDGGNHIFPLAYGVVDNETKDNWLWFLQHV